MISASLSISYLMLIGFSILYTSSVVDAANEEKNNNNNEENYNDRQSYGNPFFEVSIYKQVSFKYNYSPS